MRTRIIDFKKQLYELYGKHIEELKDLSVNEIEDIVLPNDDMLVAGIFNDVKTRIEAENERRKNVRELKAEETHFAVEEPEAKEPEAVEEKVEEPAVEKPATPQPELSKNAKKAEDEYLKYMMGESGADNK